MVYICHASALKNDILRKCVNRHINSKLTAIENIRQLMSVRLLKNSFRRCMKPKSKG